jgi:hypothetical protein
MRPPCKLVGKDGNVFNLLYIVRDTLKKQGLVDELESFDREFEQLKAAGGKYNDVLCLIMRYVEVE